MPTQRGNGTKHQSPDAQSPERQAPQALCAAVATGRRLLALQGGTWNFVGCLKVSGPYHDGNIFYLDVQTHKYNFEGQKRAQNGGFGSKSSSRKSSEVRLGPEGAGHLPRCCLLGLAFEAT